MSIGGTNSKIDANNKTVKKQYAYDKEMRDYNWNVSQTNYEQAQQLRDLKIKNDKQNVDNRNKTAAQNYNYQTQLQNDQYTDKVNAYNQSITDFKTQKKFNKKAFNVSLEAEERKRDESLISNLFDKKTDKLNFQKDKSSLQFEESNQDLAYNTAKKDTANKNIDIDIRQKAQNKIYNQQTKISDAQNDLLDKKITQLGKTRQNKLDQFGNQIDISKENSAQLRTDKRLLTALNNRDSNISSQRQSQLDSDISDVGLQQDGINADKGAVSRQQSALSSINARRNEITDERVDSVQQVINSLNKRSNSISRTDSKDKDIAQARQDILASEANKIRAKKNLISEQEAADLTIFEAEQGINQAQIDKNTSTSDAADAQDLEDAGLITAEDQALADKSAQALEQAGFLGGDLNRKYSQQVNQNIAQRMENYAEQMRAKGSVAALGRRGQSVDSQAQSALAQYGRQQAQLVNSLVFASQDKSSSEQQLSSKTSYEQNQVLNERGKLVRQRSKQVIDKNLKKDLLAYDNSIKEQQSTIKTAERQKALLEKNYQEAIADESLTENEKNVLISKRDREKQVIDADLRKSSISYERLQRQNDKQILRKEESIADEEAASRKAQLSADFKKLTYQDSILSNKTDRLKSDKTIERFSQEKNNLTSTAQKKNLSSKLKQESYQRESTQTDRKQFKQDNKLAKQSLKTDKTINRKNKNISSFEKQQQDLLNTNNKKGLVNALEATKEEVRLAKENITNRMGFNKQEWKNNKSVFEANEASAEKAFTQASNQLKLDKYSANLQAKGNLSLPPQLPTPLPVPQELPYTNFIKPSEPLKPPKPIKGTLGKTSVWNNISDGINVAATVMSIF